MIKEQVWIKRAALVFAAVFLAVGLIFLFTPEKVLILFNHLSLQLDFPTMPLLEYNFYLILAVAYMYLVALLAYLIYKHPTNEYFILLLTHAKLISALVSIYLLFKDQFYLIYLTNGIIDGAIGLGALFIYFKVRD